MPRYTVRLKRKEVVAEGTMAFCFEKPSGFQFKPGQFVNLTLVNPPETDAKGDVRTFSIASAPHEEDLIVATRLRDTAFKRVLQAIPPGGEIAISGPFGSFTLHADSSRPGVFIAGGIGVTPFRSMILHATRNKLPYRLLLFYSNRRPEDAAFLRELQTLENENGRYTFIGTMTQLDKSTQAWLGMRGPIDKQILSECIADLKAPIYYLAGPPGMVSSIQRVLADLGITEDSVYTDKFDGY